MLEELISRAVPTSSLSHAHHVPRQMEFYFYGVYRRSEAILTLLRPARVRPAVRVHTSGTNPGAFPSVG